MAIGPLGYEPHNKFHKEREVRILTKEETHRRMGSAGKVIAAAIATSAGSTSGPLARIATALENVSLDKIETAITNLTTGLSGIKEAVQHLGRQETDNVTALYAAAVDTTGDIVGRTVPGKWLNAAKYTSLKDIVASAKGKSGQQRRAEFIRRLRDEAANFQSGLPTVMTDDEIGRFYDLVPAVLKAITDSQNP